MPRHASHDNTLEAQELALLANRDVFVEEQQNKQKQLDALLNHLAPREEKLQAAHDLEALQSFLASGAAQQDKIDQLVNFLADGPVQEPHDELMANTDIFADEQAKKQKELERLVDRLANGTTATTTALLATDAADVEVVNGASFLNNVIGGAVLLLVAVVLAAVTKRSRAKEDNEDERTDFGYSILYE